MGDARIDAAVMALMSMSPDTTWGEAGRLALAAADAVERPGVERLVAALRDLMRELEPDTANRNAIVLVSVMASARKLLAECGATNGRRTMSLPKKEVEMMTCAECGRSKAWRDGFPSSIYAVCWQCNCNAHMRAAHAPKKPGWFKRFRAAWKAASAPPPSPASFLEWAETVAGPAEQPTGDEQ